MDMAAKVGNAWRTTSACVSVLMPARRMLSRTYICGGQCPESAHSSLHSPSEAVSRRAAAGTAGCELQPKRLLIESRWVSTPLALAGKLRTRRLNN
jgi:hypothetical protein